MNDIEAAWDWFLGMIEGDFSDDQTTGQIVVGTVISMIPVIDQIADIRDVIANLFHIRKDPEDVWKWVALVTTLIGLVPVLGSLLKGVFKTVLKFVKAGGKDAPKALGVILAILRGAGKGDPVAFLRKLPYAQYTKQVLRSFDDILNGFIKGIHKASDYMSSRFLKWALGDTAKRLHVLEAELQKLQKLGHDKIPEAMQTLKKEVDELLAHAKPAELNGSTDMSNALVHSTKPLMRLEYETAVKRISENVGKMRKAGKSEEEIAKWANQERRDIGKYFKDKTDPELRKIIYKRNAEKYGDELGPKYEDLRRGYWVDKNGNHIPIGKGKPKTDTEITKASTNAGGDDFPWDSILEFNREKKMGDPNSAKKILKKIDQIVNGRDR